MLNFIC